MSLREKNQRPDSKFQKKKFQWKHSTGKV